MDENLPRDMIFQYLFTPICRSPPYLRTPLPGCVGLWYLSPALLSSRFTIPRCQKGCSLPHKQGCRALSYQLKVLICHQGCSPSAVCKKASSQDAVTLLHPSAKTASNTPKCYSNWTLSRLIFTQRYPYFVYGTSFLLPGDERSIVMTVQIPAREDMESHAIHTYLKLCHHHLCSHTQSIKTITMSPHKQMCHQIYFHSRLQNRHFIMGVSLEHSQ